MQERRGKYLISIIVLLSSINLGAQEITVKGGFVEDSLLIGQDVNYWVSASYPPDLEMVFPDSLYSFAPFEFSSKIYYPTQVKEGLAFDSTVYTIQSFEIDKVQYLNLPVAILKGNDSTIINTPIDSIYLTELAPMVTDTTKLKTNLDYQLVDTQFNYPLMYYIIGGLIILTIIILLAFGKKILRWLKLKKLHNEYAQYADIFATYIRKLKTDPEPSTAERALFLWKKYHERLEKIPFTILTTKEILDYEFTSELKNPLQNVDRMVYGRKVNEFVFQDFQQLEEFSQHRYNEAYNKIKQNQTDTIPKTKDEETEIAATKITQFGLTLDQLNEELRHGGKFVIYYYTISIIVFSFRRSSKVKFISNDENGVIKGLPYTLITFFLGWWGIPWGFIYTPHSLYVNLKGGKDVTAEILKENSN
ncbi:hypothetical protein SAMN05421640_3551 [Ekhidna lutea]|uniref:Uncharacterized protein n=1 Tax=Ekhidna lutea TaxID=447679 RepID=A0A239M0D5_EKHLU|nr:hypothetical protein [Ekhidna lutea]SNT36216.1 hypothetical protein SAMN05421640_3551 [Ekhidna lutea]